MLTYTLRIELDELDADSIELPQDDIVDSLATGYATTEIGVSCAACEYLNRSV